MIPKRVYFNASAVNTRHSYDKKLCCIYTYLAFFFFVKQQTKYTDFISVSLRLSRQFIGQQFTLTVRCLPQRRFQSFFCNYTTVHGFWKTPFKCNGKHVYPSLLFHFLYSLHTSISSSLFSLKRLLEFCLYQLVQFWSLRSVDISQNFCGMKQS